MVLKSTADVSFHDRKRWSDGCQAHEWKKNEWHLGRFFGPIYTDYKHIVVTKKDKRYPEFCHAWDEDANTFYAERESRCECCRLKISGQPRFFMNWFDAQIWEERPAQPKPDWSPISMIEVSQTLLKQLQGLQPINNGFPVEHPTKGALIQIKFNPDAEPANMYAASMDNKNWEFPPEVAALEVVQTLPDGSKVRQKPDGTGVPAGYVYYRAVSGREDMLRSLKRHGYYDKEGGEDATKLTTVNLGGAEPQNPQQGAQATAKPVPPQMTQVMTPEQVAAQPVTEVIDVQASAPIAAAAPAAPAAPAAVTAPSPAAPAATVPDGVDPSTLKAADCPAEYGKFANTMVCYTKCKAKSFCREASGV